MTSFLNRPKKVVILDTQKWTPLTFATIFCVTILARAVVRCHGAKGAKVFENWLDRDLLGSPTDLKVKKSGLILKLGSYADQ